jgi:hypothetical protein
MCKMYFKASAVACLICVISSASLASPLEPASAGQQGFKRIVVDISRVNRANCPHSRARCFAVNHEKSRVVLVADQFLTRTGEGKDLFGSEQGLAGRSAGFGFAGGGSGGALPQLSLLGGGGSSGGGSTGGGSSGGDGSSDGSSDGGASGGSSGGAGGGTGGGAGETLQPSAVPLPSSAILLMLALSLGLLSQGRALTRRLRRPARA